MSTELMKFAESGVPAHIQNAGLPNQNEGLITTGDAMSRISIRGRRWRFKQPSKDDQVLDEGIKPVVLIVGFSPAGALCAKGYYEKGYEPDSSDPPDCSSANGVTPDSWIETPVHTACGTCPMNVFKSAKNGKGKACSDKKRLIVLPALPAEGIALSPLFVLDTPATSLKSLSNLARELNKVSVSVESVLTELSFVDAEYPQIDFKPIGWPDAAQVAAVKTRMPDVVELLERLGSSGPHKDGEDAPAGEAGSEVQEPAKEEPAKEEPKVEGMELVKDGELQFFATADMGNAMISGWTLPPAGPLAGQKSQQFQEADDVVLDSANVPWNENFHSGTKSQTAKGRWGRKRGVSEEVYDTFAAKFSAGTTTSAASVGETTDTDGEGAGEGSADLGDIMKAWGAQ